MSGMNPLLISSYDSVDAPARAVIEKNKNNRILRSAKQTKQELDEICDRVELTLHNYEFLHEAHNDKLKYASQIESKAPASSSVDTTLEFVDSLAQLTSLLSNPLSKKKYQHDVTIFVIGYENTCCTRLELLMQINEFFHHYGQERLPDIEFPDFNIDQVGHSVRATLEKAEQIQTKLTDVSQEVATALHKLNVDKKKGSKKKLEKELLASKGYIASITEKLILAQADITKNDERISLAFRSLEIKQVEIERMRAQIEASKRKNQDFESLKQEIENKILQLNSTRQEKDKLQLNLSQLEEKLSQYDGFHNGELERQTKLKLEQEARIQSLQEKVISTRRDVQNLYEKQIADLRYENKTEMDSEKTRHRKVVFEMEETIQKLKLDLEKLEMEKHDTINRFLTHQANEEMNEKNKKFNDYIDRVVKHEKELKSMHDNNRILAAEKMQNQNLLKQRRETVAEEVLSKSKTKDVYMQTEYFKFSNSVSSVEFIPLDSILPIVEENVTGKSIDALTNDLIELRSKYNQNVMLISKLLAEKQLFDEERSLHLSRIEEVSALKQEEAEKELMESVFTIKQLEMLLVENCDAQENVKVIEDPGAMESPILDEKPSSLVAPSSADVSSRARNRVMKKMLGNHPMIESIDFFYKKLVALKENVAQMLKLILKSKKLQGLPMEEVVKEEDDRAEFESYIVKMTSNSNSIVDALQNIIPSLVNHLDDTIHSEDSNHDTVHAAITSPIETEESCSRDSTPNTQDDTSNRTESSSKQGELLEDYKKLIYKYGTLKQDYKRLKRKFYATSRLCESTLQENYCKMKTLETTVERLNCQTNCLTQESNFKEEEYIFTRVDGEYNQQALKRGLHQRRLNEENVKEVDETMKKYLSIPLKRLIRLVRRYVHHTRMKSIETAVEGLGRPEHNVNITMNQMECLQNVRISRWNSSSDELAKERTRLAKILLKRLGHLETQSGIFLIKPYRTFQSKSAKAHDENDEEETKVFQRIPSPLQPRVRLSGQLEVKSKGVLPKNDDISNCWKPHTSVELQHPADHSFGDISRIPKILELDVNRAMYSENQISVPVSPSQLMKHRDNQLNIISYMTVDRLIGGTDAEMMSQLYSVDELTVKRPHSLPALKHRVSLVTKEHLAQ